MGLIRNYLLGVLFVISLMFQFSLQAQEFNFDEFLRASENDANTLLENYLQPAFKSFGYGINGGWYNTARPHNTLGLDLTFTLNAAIVPSSDEFFTFRQEDYEHLALAPGSSSELPTLMGPDEDGPELLFDYQTTVDGEDVTVEGSFNSPPGSGVDGLNVVPVPTLNLGVGVFKNTDVKIRYVPKTTPEEFEINLFGIGVMHDIGQWMKGSNSIDLSILAAYTGANVKYVLDSIGIDGTDQRAEFFVKAYNIQALASKKLSLLTIYSGFGFSTARSSFNLKGSYVVQPSEEQDDGSFSKAVILEDPIDLNFKNSGMRLTLGLRLTLAFITIHADYTIQEYNMFAGGIGISIK